MLIVRTTPTSGENRNSEIFSVVSVFLALPALALVARFKSKRLLHGNFEIDDYLLLVAFVSMIRCGASASTHPLIGPYCRRGCFVHMGYNSTKSERSLLTDSIQLQDMLGLGIIKNL